jgi:hypothetical protein
MTARTSQIFVARPIPPEIPKSAGTTNDQIDRNIMGIESTIRWKGGAAHLLHGLCELTYWFSSKRCACSISAPPNGLGFLALTGEAPSKRSGASR